MGVQKLEDLIASQTRHVGWIWLWLVCRLLSCLWPNFCVRRLSARTRSCSRWPEIGAPKSRLDDVWSTVVSSNCVDVSGKDESRSRGMFKAGMSVKYYKDVGGGWSKSKANKVFWSLDEDYRHYGCQRFWRKQSSMFKGEEWMSTQISMMSLT